MIASLITEPSGQKGYQGRSPWLVSYAALAAAIEPTLDLAEADRARSPLRTITIPFKS